MSAVATMTSAASVDEEWTEEIFKHTLGKPFDQVRIPIPSFVLRFDNKKHK